MNLSPARVAALRATLHPCVSAFLQVSPRRDKKGRVMALFLRSAALERRMQNGYRPYHTTEHTQQTIERLICEVEKDHATDPDYRDQQLMHYRQAVRALEQTQPTEESSAPPVRLGRHRTNPQTLGHHP